MKILFLDDDSLVVEKAQNAYKNATVLSIANTEEMSIDFLKSKLSYDVVHLGSNFFNGEFVSFLCENNHIYSDVIKAVAIHSRNWSALEAFKELRKAGYLTFYIPFGVRNWDIANHPRLFENG